MFRAQRSMVGWLLVAAAGVVVAGQAYGQFGRGPARPEARGMLKSVDASAGTVTVSMYEPRKETREAIEKTYTLAKDAEVVVAIGGGGGRRGGGAFKEAKLVDLPSGTSVALTLSADQTTVEAIVAEGPMVRGHLKAVDAAKKTLTVTLAPGRGGRGEGRGEPSAEEEKTYTIAPGAEIGLDDGRGRRFSIREVQITDLPTGSLVTLWLSVDQKQVQGILAEGPSVSGQVKAVDAGKNTLTLTLGQGRGGEAEERILAIAPDAQVFVDDGRGRRLSIKEIKLADVPVGAAVSARLSADQTGVTFLRAEGPSLGGMIKSVDAAKGTITFAVPPAKRGDDPMEKTLPLAKDVHVFIDGAEAKLTDIKIADDGPHAMLRLTLDQSMVQLVAVGTARGR
jgi:hypothetical protein